jgi:hypothetical protein
MRTAPAATAACIDTLNRKPNVMTTLADDVVNMPMTRAVIWCGALPGSRITMPTARLEKQAMNGTTRPTSRPPERTGGLDVAPTASADS